MKLYGFITIACLFCVVELYAQADTITKGNCISNPDILDGQKVYLIVDSQPEYPGGISKFFRILKNINFSECDPGKSTIHLTFLIDTVGNIRNPCSRNSDNSDACTENAIKVMQKSEPWKPALLNGKKVCTRIFFPIKICYR